MSGSPFANRLKKNVRRLRRWARREGLTAYRLYDHDIPEYAFTVDWYAGEVVVSELAPRKVVPEVQQEKRDEVQTALLSVLELQPEAIHWKVRAPKIWGQEQYEKRAQTGRRIVVDEGGLRFWVNLEDYLDTGLFLDHRNTRARVREEAQGKRFLNLFAYTGSFTVYAAAGGATQCTTVDLSNTYLAWARDNLALNELWKPERHELVRADVLRWLRSAPPRSWDLIVLDPPSFSVSKEMRERFEVQRDYVDLVRDALSVLAPGGSLYFSTHFRDFRFDASRFPGVTSEELTPGTIPEDFHQRTIHRCWRLRKPRG